MKGYRIFIFIISFLYISLSLNTKPKFMKRSLLPTFIFLFFALCSQAQRVNLDSLYNCLDNEITKSEKYIQQRELRIDKIKAKLSNTSAMLDRHRLSWNLFKEYQAYMNDSAINYLNYCIDIASKTKQQKLLVSDYIALIHQYAATGFYNEALEYLKYIDGSKLKGQQLIDYYACCNHLYGEMGCYSKDAKLKNRCFRLSCIFRDSLYSKASPNSNIYLWRKVSELTTDNKFNEAMKECDKWMKQVKPNTHDYANMAFFRSEIYKGMHNIPLCKYWLAISALCDIRDAVMDQASLWSLANMLSREGNLERSNRYVEYSWNCTQRYNTHLRSWLISPVLGVISDTYKTNLRKANYQLKTLIGAVSLLSIFLLASYIYVCHKKRQLSIARNELKTINWKLESLNSKLSGKNEELSSLNTKLSETNRLKDEYIGKFLSACSEYIDKIDNYRMRDIDISRDEDRAELKIVVDKEKIASHGLSSSVISMYVRNRVNGYTAGYLKEDGDEYDIRVSLKEENRNSISDIENITIPTAKGSLIKLSEIASIQEYWCPPEIERKSRQRIVTVAVTPYETSLGELATAIQKEVDKMDIPAGVTIRYGGDYEDQQETFGDLGMLLALIIMLVYIVMASQFESFAKPFIMMMSVPFAITGVIFALLITNTSLDMIGALGVVMLVGIVVKNGIVLVDYTNLMRDRGYELNKAIELSGASRLRPVLMTALTTVLGMVPMALSSGEGSEMWQPMGIVVMGGLLVSTLVTLIVVPVLICHSVFM